jgi:hypothetical protein
MPNLKSYYDNHYYKMKIISMKTTTNVFILFYDGYGQDLEVVLLNFINYGISWWFELLVNMNNNVRRS